MPTLILTAVLGITTLSMVELSSFRVRTEYARWASNQAYYHAENALNWALQMVADAPSTYGGTPSFVGNYSVSAGNLSMSYLTTLYGSAGTDFKNAWVTVAAHTNGVTDLYLVTASAKVRDRVRTLQSTVRKNPPSTVFDYEYFLNNWGWWWGSTITGYGDNRANWDFDFRYTPTVNGSIFASGGIESNMVAVNPLGGSLPFAGLAATDPASYVHAGTPRVQMPNLKDFTYYQAKATTNAGKLYLGTNLVVSAVHTNASKPGLYLKGTASAPVKISGPVVIPGDVIISGPITGVGTLYVGGNLYVAGDMTYVNGPDFSGTPASMTQANRDAWVQNSLTAGKDLIAFAVREAILGGNVNDSGWKTSCYDAASYGLKNVGAEGSLGKDGIAGTPDDGVAFRDTNGDGTPDSAWYDADGDGVVDVAYNYSNDVQLNTTRAGKIYNYPTATNGTLVAYESVSTNNFNRVDGILYCNHAMAMKLDKSGAVMNGAVICRDEAIIFTGSLKFVYDPRVHSRYSTDPNRYIDLGLPVAAKIRQERVDEIKPVDGFYVAN